METKVKKTSKKKQYLCAGLVNFGQIIAGHTIGWISPVQRMLQNAEETPLDRVITNTEGSWMLFITYAGIIGGPLISGYLCNVLGRRPCLYFGGTLLFLSYIMMALGKNIVVIFIARSFVGIGIGVVFTINLVFLAELASTKLRGTLLTLTGLSTTQGILTVYSMGSTFSYPIVNGVVAFLCAEYVAFIYFLVPESPIYLVMKGKEKEATATLTKLGRQAEVLYFDEFVANTKDEPKSKMNQLTELYTDKSNRRATFIIISLNILTQFSGVLVVIAFVSYIYEMTGSDLETHLDSKTVGITQFFVSIIAPIFVYTIGRKTLLLTSCAVCALSLFSLGTYFYVYSNNYPVAEDLKWVSVVSIMVFCTAYYSGMGFIPNTYAGEMFTDTCRGVGVTFTVTISWLFGFGEAVVFGYILSAWGPSVTFWLFSFISALAFIFTIVFVPEIKKKTLPEIRELLCK